MNQKWAVEWSQSQGCFHIDTLDRSLMSNLRAYRDGISNDYQILGIFDSNMEAGNFANNLRKLKEETP